jgi:hypothetical protein
MQPAQNPPSQPASTNPIITALSVTQGQPGDPVMINGSNFGSGLGEIHFVIANGRDVVAPAGAIWSDNQIFTSVPDATGLLAFNGQVYIKRATDQKLSNLVVFRFEPTLEIREIRSSTDLALMNGTYIDRTLQIIHQNFNLFSGASGNDVIFKNTRLKNDWVSHETFVYCHNSYCHGGVSVADSKLGTNWPYLDAGWWIGSAYYKFPYFYEAELWYGFAVHIRGPKGVPDGVVVP